MSLIGRGTNGTVYQLNDFIVVKKARTGDDEQADHANEQEVFRFLRARPQIPYLIRCFYSRPNDTFLELAANGSVAMLLRRHQERNGIRVLKVLSTLNIQEIYRWMRQLCLATAGLEAFGLTHGDIRPENMLLDLNWNLKLADIDRATKIGEDVVVMTEPFGRLLSDKNGHGEGAGSYGQAGARMDTFAIGSVFYTLLRGHEPYETEPWGPEHFVILGEKLQNQEFPLLTDSTSDAITSRCWNGGYCSVTELLAEFSDEAGKEVAIVEDQQLMELRQLECQNLIKSGIVDELERY